MKQITLSEAIGRMLQGERVMIATLADTMPIGGLRDAVDNGAIFVLADSIGGGVAEQEQPKKKQQKKKQLDYGKMQALRNAGWTLKQIAEEMGCSDATVSNNTKPPGDDWEDR